MKRNFKLSNGLVMVVAVFIVLIIFIGVMSEKSESNENNESPVVEENIPDNSEPEEEYIPKEQTVPKEEAPIEPSESNEAEEAVELVRPQIDSAFSGLDYSLKVVENTVVLVLNVPSDEVARGVASGEWSNLVSNAKMATENAKSFLQSQGNNSSMSVLLGDVAADRYYLCVMDGVVIYDVSNELLQ